MLCWLIGFIEKASKTDIKLSKICFCCSDFWCCWKQFRRLCFVCFVTFDACRFSKIFMQSNGEKERIIFTNKQKKHLSTGNPLKIFNILFLCYYPNGVHCQYQTYWWCRWWPWPCRWGCLVRPRLWCLGRLKPKRDRLGFLQDSPSTANNRMTNTKRIFLSILCLELKCKVCDCNYSSVINAFQEKYSKWIKLWKNKF